jgi:hypothetical protein
MRARCAPDRFGATLLRVGLNKTLGRAEKQMTKKVQTFWCGLSILLFLVPALSAELIYQIDIAGCEKEPCYSKWIQTLDVEKNVSVQAWFDIVDPFKEGSKDIYPLFNVFNNTGAAIKVRLGMRLLDADRKLLVETSQETSFTPFSKEESAYKTYRSITPTKLTAEQIRRAKFVAVIYQKM